ncbi:MAG: M28 family peptidase [Gammaproteobacteria bacterium]|nr:M28 family peptidase [Gammaproteobacteria bacterium]
MLTRLVLLTGFALLSSVTSADLRTLMPEDVLHQIAEETSGEAAKRNLDTLTLNHRMRGSDQFDRASTHIVQQLRQYGLDEVAVLEYVADGETMFGTQKSRKVWDVRFAELWELVEVDGTFVRQRRLANWDAVPLSLAQDSLSGEVTTTLVDIGAGTADSDYDGKDIRGRLVLTSSQPGRVVERAVGELGAAGIISYAPNQRSAWWKEDDRLVRWGHLSSFPKTESFGFMISLGEARKFQARLAAGEIINLHAKVDASHEVGQYRFAQAAILGADAQVGREEIILTCHLDHPRPGANDNASGCVSILETARTLSKLIGDGVLPRPARTIRFLWPAEIEGSIIYLTQRKDTALLKANIHMDMVGGGPQTKSVFRISGGPISVPTFIADVGFEIGHFVNEQTERFASGDDVRFPLNAPEGGKEPLLALMEGIDMGSDHDVFREGSWRIPGLYLHDWPDRYIHTNFDSAAMIDPTKLKRAAFIGAVSALYLANFSARDVPALLQLLRRNALARSGTLLERIEPLDAYDAAAVSRILFAVERRKIHSIEAFAELPATSHDVAVRFIAELEALIATPEGGDAGGGDTTVYSRNDNVQGTMSAFGYSYMRDKYGDESYARLRLPEYSGSHGSAGEYLYEALNLVNGKRTVSEIRDWLTAELGPVPLDLVSEYLRALEQIDVIQVLQ